jgi:hypothetical protein
MTSIAQDGKTVKPPKLSGLDVAFGCELSWLPAYASLPENLRRFEGPWVRAVEAWFFEGPDKAWLARITAKPWVDRNDALRAVQAVLGSWDIKHEHKTAGAAYLLSSWFDDPALAEAPRE